MTSSVALAFSNNSRLDHLNGLSLAIARHKNRTAAFEALDLQDRTRILGVLKIAKFDWTTIERLGLKGRIQKVLKTMAKELGSQPTQHILRVPVTLAIIPNIVMTTNIGHYLTGRDLLALHFSFKAASLFGIASHIIHHNRLDWLIQTYLRHSASNLTENDKAKALEALVSFAYRLSEIEKLPRPHYSTLMNFFKLVEARNLIRMVRALHEQWNLQDLDKTVGSLKIPEDHRTTLKKAELIRKWFKQHREFIATINGVLNLATCNLSLLPKEIGRLKALRTLFLVDNYLIILPKEIGQLRSLSAFYLDHNYLIILPKELGLLRSLSTLFLTHNSLVNLPQEIGRLSVLQILRLNDNHLATVPKQIAQLDALKILDLCNNRLAKLPKELGWIGTLTDLHLHGNGIVQLPENLENYKETLAKQNKKLQLKNLLDRMMLCLKNTYHCEGILPILGTLEALLSKETRSKLEQSLYETCRKASKTDPKLFAKLKDPKFSQKAFIDIKVDPTLKAIAIAQFWKANKNHFRSA